MTYSAAETVTHQSVYVMTAGYRQVKIGISTDVRRRLQGVQTGCPVRVKLAGQWRTPHAKKVEKAAHAALVRYRTAGEWFNLPTSVSLAVVDTLVKANPRSNHLPSIGLPAIVFCWSCGHHKAMTIERSGATSFRCTKCHKCDKVHVIDF